MILNLKNKRGVILIAVYFVIAVLLIFSVIFINRSINEKDLASRQKNIAEAFYLAEAGLDRGLAWLRDQPNPPGGIAPFAPNIAGCQNDPCGTLCALGAGAYCISIDPDNNNPNTTLDRYRIASIGRVGDAAYTLVNELQTDSYARFAYFTDTEHFRLSGTLIPVWFIGGDSIEGPTQSNTHFHIKGNPIFGGAVKSADNYTTFFNNGSPINSSDNSNLPNDAPVFQQGLDLNVEPINMPSKALDLRTAAVQGGLQLTGSTTVVLNVDGTMTVTNGGTTQNMPLPANGTLFVEGGNLTVSGTLDGRLTMGTNRDIVVNNSITYANDPRVNPNSDDMLGLIAERNVIISQYAPYDVEVDASVMALGNSFVVEKWWQGPPRGDLTVYGGIIQRERGPTGTFNSRTGQRASGYSKDYNYDPRLLNLPPPFYPTTGDYISLSWEG